MDMEMSPERYIALVRALVTASSVYSFVSEDGRTDYNQTSEEIEALLSDLMSVAPAFGFGEDSDFLEKVRTEFDNALEDYDEEIFWEELETRLGQRDYDRTLTKNEKIVQEQNDDQIPSERLFECFDKWAHEFEEYGLSRLVINKEDNGHEDEPRHKTEKEADSKINKKESGKSGNDSGNDNDENKGLIAGYFSI